MLLVARATLADPDTREPAARLIDQAFDVACTQKNSFAQMTLWELSDKSQRKQLREKFPEQFSQLHQWYNTRVGEAEQQREWDDAIRYLNLLIEPDPAQWELIQRRGKAYVQLGEFRKAIEDLGLVMKIRPNDAELLIARGEAFAGLRQWEQAADDFSKAIQLRPDDEQLRLARGRCYASIGMELIISPTSSWRWLHPQDGIDPAIEEPDFHTTFFTAGFDDAQWREDKDSPGSRGGFGYGDTVGVDFDRPATGDYRKTAYFRRYFESQAEYDSLLISMQRDDGVIIYLDGVEVRRDNVGTDAEAYDLFAAETISGSDETASVRFALAGKLEPGKHLLAISLHNRANGSSDLRIAEISLQGKKTGSASLALDDPEALIDRGSAYLEQEQSERATDDFSRAIELDPQSFRAHLRRARGYMALGKKEEARADVEKASSLMKEFDVKNDAAEELVNELREKLSASEKEK
jgi:tetratricopeptide (TPR) repeat protein